MIGVLEFVLGVIFGLTLARLQLAVALRRRRLPPATRQQIHQARCDSRLELRTGYPFTRTPPSARDDFDEDTHG